MPAGTVKDIANILETIMLICFGLSWPISLYKNIKMKSAKGMNIYFTLLIILGYIAGIVAKILEGPVLNGSFDGASAIFKFVMYIVNIVIVSCNVVVFFINKKYDKLAETDNKDETPEVESTENDK